MNCVGNLSTRDMIWKYLRSLCVLNLDVHIAMHCKLHQFVWEKCVENTDTTDSYNVKRVRTCNHEYVCRDIFLRRKGKRTHTHRDM